MIFFVLAPTGEKSVYSANISDKIILNIWDSQDVNVLEIARQNDANVSKVM